MLNSKHLNVFLIIIEAFMKTIVSITVRYQKLKFYLM